MDLEKIRSRLHRFNQSEGVRRFQIWARQIVSLRWWISRSWRFRVQFLVGLAGFLLLGISLVVCVLYEHEYAKITENFMRLQIFGPQKIYCPSSLASSKSTANSALETVEAMNFCPFHVETRHPYGSALPGVRIETEYQTPDGTPFWFHSDITGKNGTFQIPYPDMPTPELVRLVVHAEDGRKSVDFATFLKVGRATPSVSRPETATRNESYYATRLEDVTLNSLETVSDFSPIGNFRSPAPVVMTFCDPGERLLSERWLNLLISSAEKEYRPVFLGIWQGDLLLSCRPFIAGKKARKVTLSFPDAVSGLLSLLLIDYSVSPPKVLQHELVYFPLEADENKALEQERFLEQLASFMAEPKYRAEKQRLEFLPTELDNPIFSDSSPGSTVASVEKDASESDARAGKLKFFEGASTSEITSNTRFRMETRLLNAADHLLASVLAPSVSLDDRFHLKELQDFRDVCAKLDCARTSLRGEKMDDGENSVDLDAPGGRADEVPQLLQKALKLQSHVLNRTLVQPEARAKYAEDLPIVFDSLAELEHGCSEATQFKARTRALTSRFSCLALCSVLCLVWMMFMASILGLPTDRRTWFLTLGVVLFALALSCFISSQSNTVNSRESIRYETWSIESIAPVPDK